MFDFRDRQKTNDVPGLQSTTRHIFVKEVNKEVSGKVVKTVLCICHLLKKIWVHSSLLKIMAKEWITIVSSLCITRKQRCELTEITSENKYIWHKNLIIKKLLVYPDKCHVIIFTFSPVGYCATFYTPLKAAFLNQWNWLKPSYRKKNTSYKDVVVFL